MKSKSFLVAAFVSMFCGSAFAESVSLCLLKSQSGKVYIQAIEILASGNFPVPVITIYPVTEEKDGSYSGTTLLQSKKGNEFVESKAVVKVTGSAADISVDGKNQVNVPVLNESQIREEIGAEFDQMAVRPFFCTKD